jgi:uncharacterized lipoprotein YmbA
VNRHLFSLALLVTVLAVGCATTPEARFYSLTGPQGGTVGTDDGPSLAIGPVDLPRYLDRPQMVSRAGDNRLLVDEFNRWGGVLDQEITAVLARGLGQRLGTQRVYSYPSRIAPEVDYRIALEIRRFDGELGGEVVLEAAWSLVDDRTGDILDTRRVEYREPAAGPGYSAYVAALQRTLERLAQELAVEVSQVSSRP